MPKLASALLAPLLSLICFIPSAGAADVPVRVLMLGDHGHHRPEQLAKVLEPALAPEAIAVTYTDDVAALNPENLAAYDCLLFYLNTTDLPPKNEKALLDFVEGGKGLVALHLASAAFGKSDKYIALIGGRFARHQTGIFQTRDHRRPAPGDARRQQLRELGRDVHARPARPGHPRPHGPAARWGI